MKVHTLFAVICLSLLTPSLFGQTNAPADTNTIAANPIPTGQAPDDVVKKLSDLVHDGKYAEAQQLTAGLLLAYPDDQHLIKAKILLDKLIAASNSSQPTNSVAQPAASGTSEQLTGADKVEYNSLVEMAREAQQNTDLDQQKASMKQFMDESGAFLQKYPDQKLLWQIRAAVALGLDDPDAGYEAGQKLLAAGAADSDDQKLQQLIAKLKIKGWLDKQKVEDYKKYGWILGAWSASYSINGMTGSGFTEVFTKSDSGNIEGHFHFMGEGGKFLPDMRGTILNSGQIKWERFLVSTTTSKELQIEAATLALGDVGTPVALYDSNDFSGKQQLYPSGWQPLISYAVSNDRRTITMGILGQCISQRNMAKALQTPVNWTFTKVSDSQEQQSLQVPIQKQDSRPQEVGPHDYLKGYY